jgi:uncharacterized membrane protein
MQRAIGIVLRGGVLIACLLCVGGGGYYLLLHGGEAAPDYHHFPTSMRVAHTICLTEVSAPLITWGLYALILTPVCRVVCSFILFIRIRDWLYTAITALVILTLIYQFL